MTHRWILTNPFDHASALRRATIAPVIHARKRATAGSLAGALVRAAILIVASGLTTVAAAQGGIATPMRVVEVPKAAAQRPIAEPGPVDEARRKPLRLEKPAVPETADVPIRDQRSYMEALRRCAIAQSKRERANCD